MAISSEVRKAGPYNGNDVATSFAFGFKVFAATDLVVIHTNVDGVESTLTITSDYTVALNSDQNNSPGGTVTYPASGAPLPTGEKLTLTSGLPNTQTTDFTNQGGFYPKVLNSSLDRATIQIQQLAEQVARSVQVPISDSRTPADYWQALFTAADASANAASMSASQALDSKNAAGTSEVNAADSEASAHKWADNPEDTEVEPGEFSAYHYMKKAKSIANAEASTVVVLPTTLVKSTDAQAALQEVARFAVDFAGPTDPALDPANNVQAYMRWADTGSTPKMLRRRNATNSAWIAEGELFQYKANRNGDGTQNFNVASLNGGPLAGMRNKIINGALMVNQRGVSGTVTLAAGAYGHDRFKAGASGCSYTFSTVANITTFTLTAGTLMQVIEGINLQSGPHTLSWQGTAQGRIDSGVYGASGITGTAVGGTNQTVEFGVGTLSLVQYEPGTIATPFNHRPITIEELLCARYLPAWFASGAGANVAFAGGGVCYSTSGAEFLLPYPTPPRAIPTGLIATQNAFAALNSSGTLSPVSTPTYGSATGMPGLDVVLGGTAGLTVGDATILYKSSVGGAIARILATGCEL